jgi:hypothetical protein
MKNLGYIKKGSLIYNIPNDLYGIFTEEEYKPSTFLKEHYIEFLSGYEIRGDSYNTINDYWKVFVLMKEVNLNYYGHESDPKNIYIPDEEQFFYQYFELVKEPDEVGTNYALYFIDNLTDSELDFLKELIKEKTYHKMYTDNVNGKNNLILELNNFSIVFDYKGKRGKKFLMELKIE